MPTTLSVGEAVPLLAAWADRFAKAHEFRSLSIKGHALEHQGLRGPHESVDVDIVVDPSSFLDFLRMLQAFGWEPQNIGEPLGADTQHAVTLFHDLWPITMDVHRFYPGFLADPQSVFDTLWDRRTSIPIAHVHVATPDPVANAAVAALHYLRSPASGLALSGLPDLVDRVLATLGDHGVAELADLSVRLGAAETLRPFLEQVGASPVPVASAPAEAVLRWKLTQDPAPSKSWVLEILERPLREWPGAIRHAVMLTDAEIDANHRGLGVTRRRARLLRLRRGVRNLPVSVHAVARYKLATFRDRHGRR